MDADPRHLPAPAELAPAVPWAPKRLVTLTPDELARLTAPQQRRRLPVLRAARRAGKAR